MTRYSVPLVDEANPLYCPWVPAVTYLDALRRRLQAKSGSRSSDDISVPSFAQLLDESLDEEDLIKLVYRPVHQPYLEHMSSSDPFPLSLWNQTYPPQNIYDTLPRQDSIRSKSSSSAMTFSDLLGPIKRERSALSVNEGSFELSAKAERLRYFKPKVPVSPYDLRARRVTKRYVDDPTDTELALKVRTLEDELYGPRVGTESPRGIRILVSHLDSLLPGIRLKERLFSLDSLTHQGIVDLLASGGHLNARVLNILRTSEIEYLDLTTSIMDEEGLNLDARGLLQVFSKPNSFLFLYEINLSGAHLRDFDFTSIHHLPRLSRLWVSNTGIGNEAIFHLTSLRRSLTELDIAFNPLIDDDSVPALLCMTKLGFLTLLGTSIGMPGLRRLAAHNIKHGQVMNIEIPLVCEDYIDSMHKRYVLNPQPPLIVDPTICAQLSIAALKHNLSEHAAINPELLVSGSKAELVERLQKVLTLRKMDICVRQLVWGGRERIYDNSDDSEVF